MNPTLRLLFWEITAACNLRCRHCRRLDEVQKPLPGELTTEEGKQFLRDLARIARPILVLSGGEPTMRVDLFELAEFAAGLDLAVALATNGTSIDRVMAERIADSPIERVAVSFDGADSKTHDSFRGQNGAFRAALRGWKYLQKVGVSLQVNTTLSRHNLHQLPSLYQLARRLKADAIHFFVVIPVGCGLGMRPDQFLKAKETEETLEWIYRESQTDGVRVKPTCAPQYFRIMVQKRRFPRGAWESEGSGNSEMSLRGCRRQPKQSPPFEIASPSARNDGIKSEPSPFSHWTKGCLAGTGIGFVSSCGDVFPCGYLPMKAGNVKEIPFDKIWQESPLLNQLRDPTLLQGKCGVCSFRTICGGCRARAWAETQDPLAEDSSCVYQPKEIYSKN